jgi:hypothetical protein
MDQFEIPGLSKEEILGCMHSAFKEAIIDLLEYKDVPYSTSFREEMIDAVREAVEESFPSPNEIEDTILIGVQNAMRERNG